MIKAETTSFHQDIAKMSHLALNNNHSLTTDKEYFFQFPSKQ
jgi:hypothetical protein